MVAEEPVIGEYEALRERIASAVGPNLSAFGTSPGAQEFADGVCDSIVDAVLDALGLERVGTVELDDADLLLYPDPSVLFEVHSTPVFRLRPALEDR